MMESKKEEDIVSPAACWYTCTMYIHIDRMKYSSQFDWVIEIHYFDHNIPRTSFLDVGRLLPLLSSFFSNIRFSRLLLIGICDYKWTQQGNRLKRNHRLKGIRFITTFFFIGVLSYFTGSSYSIFYTSSIRSQPTQVHTHSFTQTNTFNIFAVQCA